MNTGIIESILKEVNGLDIIFIIYGTTICTPRRLLDGLVRIWLCSSIPPQEVSSVQITNRHDGYETRIQNYNLVLYKQGRAVGVKSLNQLSQKLKTVNYLVISKATRGPAGIPGPEGIKGITGIRGIPGVRGQQGDIGETGIAGPKGDPGPQGIKGDIGLLGEVGADGPQGDTGDIGITGIQGIPGIVGEVGAIGQDGIAGATCNK